MTRAAKKTLVAMAAVFITWLVLDFIIHRLILGGVYARTAELWRPEEEMKVGLMLFVLLVSSVVFVYIYAQFFRDKNMKTGLCYGLLFGASAGISMGYGTYSVMPIPYYLALGWFLGTLFEATAGGLVVGLIVAEEGEPAAETESSAEA